MGRALKWVGIAVAGLLGLAALAAAGLVVALERGWLNGPVERVASAQLGRAVDLEGGIRIRPGPGGTLRLALGPVSLANPDWAMPDHPTMARVERLEASLRLRPLLRGDVELPEIVVRQPEAGLLRLADGRANWAFDLPPSERPPGDGPPALPRVESLRIERGAVGLEDEVLGARTVLRLDATAAAGGDLPVRVDGSGTLADLPLALALRASPIPTLEADGRPFELAGTVEVGGTRTGVEATLESLADLNALRAEAALGTDAGTGTLLKAFGVPLGADRPLPPVEARLALRPGEGGSRLDLRVDALGQALRARARVPDLASPLEGSVLTAAVGGERPRDALAALGVPVAGDLPAWALALTAAAEAGGRGLAVRELGLRFGESWAQGAARVAALPGLQGLELDLRGALRGVEPVLAALGVEGAPEAVPDLPFAVTARREGETTRARVEATLAEDRLAAAAEVTGDLDAAAVARAELRVDAAGSHLRDLLALAGVELRGRGALPEYRLAARVTREGEGLRVDELDARLGGNTVTGGATVARLSPLDGLEARLEADLPRLTRPLRALGLVDIPVPDLKLTVEASVKEGANRLGVDTRFGRDRLRATVTSRGELAALDALRLEAKAEGSDLGRFLPLLGLTEQPVPNYSLDATVAREADGGTTVDVEAALGPTRASARGRIAAIETLTGVRLDVAASGPSPAELLEIFDLPGIELPPYSVRGRLATAGREIRVTNLDGLVGESDVQGRITVDLAADPPAVRADLTSRLVDFDDLGTLVGAPPDTEESASGGQRAEARELEAEDRLLPDARFNADAFENLDLDVRFKGQRVDAPNLPIRDLAAHVVVKDKRLTARPLDMTIAGGKLRLDATLDGSRASFPSRIDLRISGLQLQRFLAEFGVADYGLGTFSGRAELRSTGASVREIAANADGRLAVVMEDGAIEAILLEAVGLDITETIAVWLLDRDATPDTEKVPVRCLVGDFEVQDGGVAIRTLLLDTPDEKITVEGSVDLGREAMDLLVHAIPRDASVGSSRMPVRIDGTFREPGFHPAPGKVESRALGWLLAPLAALVPFVELGAEDDQPCIGVVDQVREEAKSRD